MKIDLHTHSQRSDGSLSPLDVIREAEKAGIQILSITDHDILMPAEELADLQAQTSIRLISGLEISCYDPKSRSKVHILAYLPHGKEAPRLQEVIGPTIERRRQRGKRQKDILTQLNFLPANKRPKASQSPKPIYYKQHLMEALSDAPYGSPKYTTLYRTLFKNHGPVAGDISYPTPEEALEAGRQDGLVMVLAHPGLYDNFDLIPHLVTLGLEGLEVLHPEHTSNDVLRAKHLASRYGLRVSGGSDTHGSYGPADPYGQDLSDLLAEGFQGVWDHPSLKKPLPTTT